MLAGLQSSISMVRLIFKPTSHTLKSHFIHTHKNNIKVEKYVNGKIKSNESNDLIQYIVTNSVQYYEHIICEKEKMYLSSCIQ